MHDNSTVILIGEEVHMLSKKSGSCMCSFSTNFVNYMYLILFMVHIHILTSTVGFIE